MRSVFLVVLMAVLAAVTGVLLSRPDSSAAAMTPAATTTTAAPGSAATPAPQQASPRVTVRVGGGRDNVRVGNSVNAQGRKGRVENPGLSRRGNRSAISVEEQGVSMADEGTSGEGLLTRIHVDADDDLTAVIGFYSTIDADRAVDDPRTYSCKRCGTVLVCGVDPQCAN